MGFGGCDTHIHFYDDRYRVAPTALLRPRPATVEEYRLVQADLGLDRVVVVQPTTYGLDNSCQLDAMASFGDRARGVAVVDHNTTRQELGRLDALGVRGARFHMLPGGAVSWDSLSAVMRNIAPFGWHVQLQLNGRELASRLDQLRSLPVDLVIDHIGRFMPPVATGDRSFRALLSLVEDGRAWVKLSAPYESSARRADRYPDLGPLVAALIAAAPERILWATNWPHPGQTDPPTSNELDLLLGMWLPTPDLRHQVLVDNPATLYGF